MENSIAFSSQLDTLLPRYLRKQYVSDEGEAVVFEGFPFLKKVDWLSDFYAIPGCESVSSLKAEGKDYKDLGLYPVDAASVLPILALGLSKSGSCRVLDLCCCPGSKFQMIAERVSTESLVVGVDLSGKRLEVCRSLLRSWLVKITSKVPRLLLFEADGTTFGNPLGNLLFDSSIFLKDYELNTDRKKMNKSARIRESKELTDSIRLLEQENVSHDTFQRFDYVLVDAECTHDASYRHLKYFENTTDQSGGKWMHRKEKKRKHTEQHTISEPSTETTETTEIETENLSADYHLPSDETIPIPMRLSHQIRDWKISCEGKVQLQQTQRQLLMNGYNVLAPGGTLVYSTCSQDEAQNEDIIRWLLHEKKEAYLEDPFGHIPAKDMHVMYMNHPEHHVMVGETNTGSSTTSSSSNSSSIEYLTQLHSKFHDTSRSIQERSREIWECICTQSEVFVYRGTLPLTIRVTYEVGMSGHFLARIRKPNTNLTSPEDL